MLNKKIISIFLVTLTTAVFGSLWVYSQNNSASIVGQLNAETGQKTVEDGYYDMRIVAYDFKTGQLLGTQDFIDVKVNDGAYIVDYNLSTSSEKVYYQLCRSPKPSKQADGLNNRGSVNRCESTNPSETSLSVVECPKELYIAKRGVIPGVSISASTNCADIDEPASSSNKWAFAPSNTETQVVQAVFGERGPKGEQGEPGPAGEQGPAGPRGATGATGPAGSGGSGSGGDNQTLSFGGAQILSISGGNSVSLSSLLDNTDTLASLSCINSQVAQWNGSAWVCASSSEVDGVIGNEVTDATGSGGLVRSGSGTGVSPYTLGIASSGVTNAMLANSSIVLTAGAGLTDAGIVSLGGTTTINIGAGNGITVNADDIAVRIASSADGLSTTTSSGSGLEVLPTGVTLLQGCANNEILKWNEASDVWACAIDIDTDTDAQTLSLSSNILSLVNGGSVDLSSYLDNTDNQNLFLTIDVDNGTDPVADSPTDTLSFISGSGITITGNALTDSITIVSALGPTIDSASEIVDGVITNAKLVNSGVTITAGNGLISGGLVNLGGTVTLNVGAGTAITVNGDDIAVTANGINYTELSNSLSLDATTTTTLGTFNLVTNANSSGDIIFQDNGVAFLTLSDTGAYDFVLDAIDNPTYTITNAGSSNVITNLSGTGDFVVQDNGTTVLTVLDNGTFLFRNSADNTAGFTFQDSAGLELFQIDSSNDRVYIGDPTADAVGALLILDTKNTAGDPTGIAGAMYYNSATAKFRCFQSGGWVDCIPNISSNTITKLNVTANVSNSTTTFADVTGLTASLSSGLTYNFTCEIYYTTAATATALQLALNGPTASAIDYSVETATSATARHNATQTAYDTNTNPATGGGTTRLRATMSGTITTTAGTPNFAIRFRSEVNASAVTVSRGSFCHIQT